MFKKSLFLTFDRVICYHHFRKDYHFKAVEAQDPYKNKIEEWKSELEKLNADTRPEFVLINSPAIADKYQDRIPTVEEFDSILKTTGDYVLALNARKVHLLLVDTNIKDPSKLYVTIFCFR